MGGGGSTTSTQNTSPWSGQQSYLIGGNAPNGSNVTGGGLYGTAANLAQNQSNWPQYYGGNTYAGLNDAQQSGIQRVYGLANGTSALQGANQTVTDATSPGYTGETAGNFGQTQNVLGNELSQGFLNPWNSPAFGTVVNNTLASVIPQTSASFINGGRSDSGLATAAQTQAATNAVGNLAQNQYNTNLGIQQQAASQAANNYLTQQGNQLRGATLAPLIDQTQMQDATTALNTAGLTQQDQQNQINANVARWNYNQMLPSNMESQYQSWIQGGGSPGLSSSMSTPYFSNTMSNILGAGTSLAGIAALGSTAFSDRNLKTDIRKIGESDSGFPLYMFRYIGEAPGTTHIGLMAQDVQKERPESVIKTPIGLAVDYIGALAT